MRVYQFRHSDVNYLIINLQIYSVYVANVVSSTTLSEKLPVASFPPAECHTDTWYYYLIINFTRCLWRMYSIVRFVHLYQRDFDIRFAKLCFDSPAPLKTFHRKLFNGVLHRHLVFLFNYHIRLLDTLNYT